MSRTRISPSVVFMASMMGAVALPYPSANAQTPTADTDAITKMATDIQASSDKIKATLDGVTAPDASVDTMTPRLQRDIAVYVKSIPVPANFYPATLPKMTDFATTVARIEAVVGLMTDEVVQDTKRTDLSASDKKWMTGAVDAQATLSDALARAVPAAAPQPAAK